MVTKLETEMRLLYNIINMEGTTEKLKTIVELVIKQRFKVNGDIFKYDFSKIKDELKTLADSDKYGIDPIEQRKLLEELDEGENDSFEIDYVDKIEDELGFFTSHWRHSYSWLKQYLYPAVEPERYPYDVFIRLNYDGVKKLKMKYEIECYDATLKYNVNTQRFTVICNGKEYTMRKALTNEANTTKIIEYAWKYRNNYVTIDSINRKAGLNEQIKAIDASLKNCTIITDVLKSFTDYTDRKMKITDQTMLTISELKRIESLAEVKDFLG